MENSFLRRSSIFRTNVENGEYIPILNNLHHIASKNNNNLPTNFSINNPLCFSEKDVNYVLSKLYPERKYHCKRVNDSIFCARIY